MGKSDARSREHFNKIANTYDLGYEGKVAAALYECVLKKLDGSESWRLLDVGCGPGTFLSRISVNNKGISIFGIDIAPEMVRIAKERLGEKAEIRLCDICSDQVPWSENAFDHVVCMSTFHHFLNPKKALAEIHRVTRPQGCVTIADITSFFPMRQLYNLLVFPLLKHGDVRLYSESEFRRLLEECAFKSVNWERVANPSPRYRGFVATATPLK
jgi:ubiquinone/menaquinone biosynthesis C-methylase UbiE